MSIFRMKKPRSTGSKILASMLAVLLMISTCPAQVASASQASNAHDVRVHKMSAHTKAASLRRPITAGHRPTVEELTKPTGRKLTFSARPTDLEIFRSNLFFQPLVPMDATLDENENRVLSQKLKDFSQRKDFEDFSTLESFIDLYPKSRWRAAIEANLAAKFFEAGYFTDALKHWSLAWELSKDNQGINCAAVADYAISNLVQLEARLGRMDSLETHIGSLANRSLYGTSAAMINGAKDGLWAMKHHPENSFLCGPAAVQNLAKVLSRSQRKTYASLNYPKSTSRGTNLSSLQKLADVSG